MSELLHSPVYLSWDEYEEAVASVRYHYNKDYIPMLDDLLHIYEEEEEREIIEPRLLHEIHLYRVFIRIDPFNYVNKPIREVW